MPIPNKSKKKAVVPNSIINKIKRQQELKRKQERLVQKKIKRLEKEEKKQEEYNKQLAEKQKKNKDKHIPIYNKHFDKSTLLFSHLTRQSIDLLKKYHKDDLTNDDWKLVIYLKKLLKINY